MYLYDGLYKPTPNLIEPLHIRTYTILSNDETSQSPCVNMEPILDRIKWKCRTGLVLLA